MKFVSSSDSLDSFELSILGYGKVTKTWRDRNLLRCHFSTLWKQQSDNHSVFLQTWEIKKLLMGLRSVWHNAKSHVALKFSEPGLSIEAKALTADTFKLQIQLDHELSPTWNPYPDFPIKMDIFMNKIQLKKAIQGLSRQLEAYPER